MKNKIKNIFLLSLLVMITFPVASCGSPGDTPSPAPPDNGGNSGTFKPNAGNDLYGQIIDDRGAGVADVVVSDGFQSVVTNDKGWYQMKRRSGALYVSYSIPKGYKASSTAFYKSLTGNEKQYDFKLTRLSGDENHFNLLVMADPQVKSNSDVERFRTETMPDVKQTVDGSKLPIYGLCLGDIVDEGHPELTNSMRVLLQSTSMPFFVTIGNHDKESGKSGNDVTKTFRENFGPLNYSFNRGNVHFICLDNILYNTSKDYKGGITDEVLAWMKSDLQYVSKDKMIVVYYHIPWRQTNNKNRTQMMQLLEGYANLLMLSGHTHYQENFHGTKPYNFAERIHGAACGAWWHSNICGEGTPNGYQVYEIDGNKIVNNYYKSTRFDKSFQIRLHHGDGTWGGDHGTYGYELKRDYIVANVWNYDTNWKIQVYEDGFYSGDMTLSYADYFKTDAWAQAYHIGVVGRNPATYSQTSTHDFVYKLKNPEAKVRVVAIDNYGNQYEQTVFTDDLESAHIYK
ncbi:calcineurin-like phosphoesterase C-terminal domain-containing protein [Prevotella sp. A2931]|uniref:Calcineurin-like phosphoesterase C-terminal domain-containing protein n=1 Tax=Prevotella illustrans TaxID=2800387 RepID=A0ABS3M376_9BACT|nr:MULTISPECIES: calcineurin-like phosphoesterase C-terminal domain-containing protein [Prevotella]MBO1362636.1 calcineurin-like phosphoesterase C-terminal domain-containing protein [Prevotella illustrans]PTL25192.1 hypothetical protein C3V39_10880 [Prevotella sp. oral taxon 820]